MTLSADIQAFIENPENLALLPTILASATALETEHAELNTKFVETETMYQGRLSQSQAYNRELLSQIPTVQSQQQTPEEQLPTEQDALAHLLSTVRGGI